MVTRRRVAAIAMLALTVVGGSSTVRAADSPGESPAAPATNKAPQTAEEFFWAIDGMKKGTTPEALRATLGEPTEIKSRATAPGETTQTWLYKVTPMASSTSAPAAGAATPALPATRDVQVILFQPLNGSLGYVKSEVFLAATDQDGGQALVDAAERWKKLPSLRNLVPVVRLLPRGTPAEDVQKLLGKPVDAFIADVNVAGSDRRMTYLREPNLKVEFNLARATGPDAGLSRWVFVGATLYDEGR
jgi:hypothetical protein